MKKWLEIYNIYFWIFMIGSFIGFIWENIWTIIKRHHFYLRQGLIYEPLIPIYGIGALVFYLIYEKLNEKIKNKYLKLLFVFGIALFSGGVIEYLFSFLQEKIFGSISWTYKRFKFNINGRTSLLHASFWGILGIVYYYFFMPKLKKISKYLNNVKVKLLTGFLSFILIFDISISSLAVIRQKERRNKKSASNVIDTFLDKHYTDERLEQVFTNSKPV